MVSGYYQSFGLTVMNTYRLRFFPAIVDRQPACPSAITGIASPLTGLGDLALTFDGTVHQLSLPIGEYNYQTFSMGKNCSIQVRISG